MMGEEPADQFHAAGALAEFPAEGGKSVKLNGWHVLIARVGKDFVAINDRCSHAASPLSPGRIRLGIVMCPLHGARFELASGKSVDGANRPVRSFPVRIIDGWIEVAVPNALPGMDECPIIRS